MQTVIRRTAVCLSLSLAAVLAVGTAVEAQAPSIATTVPGAVQPGQTTNVTIKGDNLDGATQLWTSFPANVQLAPDVNNNGKNAKQVVFQVAVPEDAPVGVHGIRVVTPNGASRLQLFTVDDLPTVAAKDNNTSPSTAQPLSLPLAVEGAVLSLRRHYYQFEGKAGQKVSFDVLAGRLGSALDPMLRLFLDTDNGLAELAYNDDTGGLHGDSQFSHRLPQDGRYVLELRDIRYQGGGNYRYRLRIGDFPCVTVPYPMGAKRGTKTTLAFGGRDTEDVVPQTLAIPDDPHLDWLAVGAKRKGGRSSGFAMLSVTGSEEAVAEEPNDTLKQATRVSLGANLNGRFEKPGDVDRFVFAAKKGQRLTFDARTRSQGSPTDLYLRLQNAQGKQLAASDDAGTLDGRINYTFPADGKYQLVVEDLHKRGGSRFVYRIVVTTAAPSFALTTTTDRVNVPAGGTAAVTVNANRRGFNGPIRLDAENLPQGISAVPTVIGPGRGSVVLTLVGTEQAKRGTAVPVRIVGTANIGKTTVRKTADIDAALKSIAGGYPFPSPVLSKAFAAAAAPKAPFSLTPQSQSVTVEKGQSATVQVKLSRSKATTEAVSLALTPVPKKNTQKAGLPEGIKVTAKPVAKGKDETTVTIAANKKAPKGTFTITLVATHKKGKQTLKQNVPGIVITVK